MMFYRYIRPVRFNERRTELETLPHGGICLRFDENEDGTLSFVHARCHEDELFNKGVAKRIVDHRHELQARAPTGLKIPYTQETGVLAESVIEASLGWSPDTKSFPAQAYQAMELRELAHALEQMIQQNAKEAMKAEIWHAGIVAAGFADMYDAMAWKNDKSLD